MHYISVILTGSLLWAGISLSGCAGPKPIEEYTLARTALEAARDVGAPSYAPGFFHRAEELYQKGQHRFSENANSEAKKLFIGAKAYAEKAENATRLKKFQSGESFP